MSQTRPAAGRGYTAPMSAAVNVLSRGNITRHQVMRNGNDVTPPTPPQPETPRPLAAPDHANDSHASRCRYQRGFCNDRRVSVTVRRARRDLPATQSRRRERCVIWCGSSASAVGIRRGLLSSGYYTDLKRVRRANVILAGIKLIQCDATNGYAAGIHIAGATTHTAPQRQLRYGRTFREPIQWVPRGS